MARGVHLPRSVAIKLCSFMARLRVGDTAIVARAGNQASASRWVSTSPWPCAARAPRTLSKGDDHILLIMGLDDGELLWKQVTTTALLASVASE